jgi:hypothetical protein
MIHESRMDLSVPFARKDEAKALGARWDGTRRLWYIPAGTDLRGFDEGWFPQGLLKASRTQPQVETAANGEVEKGITDPGRFPYCCRRLAGERRVGYSVSRKNRLASRR